MRERITKEQIQYVMAMRPEATNSNTEFLIAFAEITCQVRGIPATWENIKAVYREYKPEHLVRKRRKYTPSTEEQLVKEQEMKDEYSPITNC